LTGAEVRFRLARLSGAGDIGPALALRALAFRQDAGADDRDAQDALAEHLVVSDTLSGAVVATCRLRRFGPGDSLADSYSARFFDLASVRPPDGPMIEMGRLATGGAADPEALRLLFAGVVAAAKGEAGLFGCLSLSGTEADAYAGLFAGRAQGHLLDERDSPAPLGSGAANLSPDPSPTGRRGRDGTGGASPLPWERGWGRGSPADLRPPLLDAYLALGARVGRWAVPDPELGTTVLYVSLDPARLPDRHRPPPG
jgi:putative hemolysin